MYFLIYFFFFKQKTAYELRISDWSSDLCSSDLFIWPLWSISGRLHCRRYECIGQCLIKGNHSQRGEWIYHLPGMPYYNATRAEAYFCTEAEAQAVRYRRAIVR